MKSSKLCLYHTLELGQKKAAKTKLDPQPSFDHHCHNVKLSLSYKGESDFSCLQGLSAFLVHDRGNLSKDSAHLSGVARVYVQLGQRQVEKMAQDKPYSTCVPGVSAPDSVGPSTYVRPINLSSAYTRLI